MQQCRIKYLIKICYSTIQSQMVRFGLGNYEDYLFRALVGSNFAKNGLMTVTTYVLTSIVRLHLAIIICVLINGTFFTDFIFPILVSVLLSLGSGNLYRYIETHRFQYEAAVDYCIANYSWDNLMMWKRYVLCGLIGYILLALALVSIDNAFILLTTVQATLSFIICDILENRANIVRKFKTWRYQPPVKFEDRIVTPSLSLAYPSLNDHSPTSKHLQPQTGSTSNLHLRTGSISNLHPQNIPTSNLHPRNGSTSNLHPQNIPTSNLHLRNGSTSNLHPQNMIESPKPVRRSEVETIKRLSGNLGYEELGHVGLSHESFDINREVSPCPFKPTTPPSIEAGLIPLISKCQTPPSMYQGAIPISTRNPSPPSYRPSPPHQIISSQQIISSPPSYRHPQQIIPIPPRISTPPEHLICPPPFQRSASLTNVKLIEEFMDSSSDSDSINSDPEKLE